MATKTQGMPSRKPCALESAVSRFSRCPLAERRGCPCSWKALLPLSRFSPASASRCRSEGRVHVHCGAASGSAEQALFSQAITVRRPRVLYLAGGDGPSSQLLETLNRAQVDVEQQPSFPINPAGQSWGPILLGNYPGHPPAADEQEA